MSMNEQQTRQESNRWFEMLLMFVVIIIAWPAFVLGVLARWLIKQRTNDPFPYWLGAAALGAIGTFLLFSLANPYPSLLTVTHDLVPLFSHLSTTTFTRFVGDALPLWARSLLVFPLCALVLELFGTKNLQASLLAQERQRRAIKTRKSQRAARKAAKAPTVINGKGVFGVLIENPNE